MLVRKKLFCVLLVLLISFLVLGCGSQNQSVPAKVESGVIDKEYRGVVNPEVPREFKLSEQEQREGIQKITIKCGVQIDAPTQNGNEGGENDLDDSPPANVGDDVARPKI